MEKMRILKPILILIICSSCANTKTQDQKVTEKKPIELFVAKLPTVPSSFSYDLLMQDGEGFYKSEKGDSLFCPPFVSVIGLLPDTANYYNVLYLEPGDDLYPTLKVFTKEGEVTDSQTVCYTDCAGWDCPMDSCASFVKMIDQGIIQRSLRMVITDCDSTGAKIPNATVVKIKKQSVRVNPAGKIVFDTESSE
jgi:hypothetical protein